MSLGVTYFGGIAVVSNVHDLHFNILLSVIPFSFERLKKFGFHEMDSKMGKSQCPKYLKIICTRLKTESEESTDGVWSFTQDSDSGNYSFVVESADLEMELLRNRVPNFHGIHVVVVNLTAMVSQKSIVFE